jgi:rod shape-determining protein MreD
VKWLIMSFLLILLEVFQLQIPPWTLLGDAKVPLILGLVLYYAMKHDVEHMLMAGLVGGIVQDAMSPVPLGFSSCIYCILGALSIRFRGVVMADAPLTSVLFGAAGGFLAILATDFMLSRSGYLDAPMGWMLLKAAGSALLGALGVPLVFLVAGRLDRWMGNVDARGNTA